jgi:hypothetical protein
MDFQDGTEQGTDKNTNVTSAGLSHPTKKCLECFMLTET